MTTAQEYVGKFFNLKKIHQTWTLNNWNKKQLEQPLHQEEEKEEEHKDEKEKIKDARKRKTEEKNKKKLEKYLQKEFHFENIKECDLDSIHLFNDGNMLFIECHIKDKKTGSNNIEVKQYKILLNNQTYIEEEINELQQILNDKNYIAEIEYLRENLISYQLQIGKSPSDFLINIDEYPVDVIRTEWQSKQTEYDTLETPIIKKLIDLITLQDKLNKKTIFLNSYKHFIAVKDKLFGKQGTLNKLSDTDKDKLNNKDESVVNRLSMSNIELCLQYCQLKYIDLIRKLKEQNTFYSDLKEKILNFKDSNEDSDEDSDEEYKKSQEYKDLIQQKDAIIFDILTTEKQISQLVKDKNNFTIHKGILVKIHGAQNSLDENEEDIFMGIAKSEKPVVEVTYCNKVMSRKLKDDDNPLEVEPCRKVQNTKYNTDVFDIDIIIPILNFIEFYEQIIQNPNQTISKGFIHGYKGEYDLETFQNQVQLELKYKTFTIQDDKEYIDSLTYVDKKNQILDFICKNKDSLIKDVKKLCETYTYLSDNILMDFYDNVLYKIKKVVPIIEVMDSFGDTDYYKLVEYVRAYLYNIIQQLCDSTKIEFDTDKFYSFKSQSDKEQERQRALEQFKTFARQSGTTDTSRGTGYTGAMGMGTGYTGVMGMGTGSGQDELRDPFDNRSGKKGLENIGNTCFLNVVIQLFSNIEQLRKYLFYLHSNQILDGRPLIFHFTNILKEIWSTNKNTFVSGDKIRPFKNYLSDEHFEEGAQHDSDEMFRYLLIKTHDNLMEPVDVYSADQEDNFRSTYHMINNIAHGGNGDGDGDDLLGLGDQGQDDSLSNELPQDYLTDTKFIKQQEFGMRN